MSNEDTRRQIQEWLDRSIEESKNPDRKELLLRQRRERRKRVKKVASRYGL